jgi:hypothetical protein
LPPILAHRTPLGWGTHGFGCDYLAMERVSQPAFVLGMTRVMGLKRESDLSWQFSVLSYSMDWL